MATCYPSYEIPTNRASVSQKDYSRPLHVDCSVEYELPNQAKPPQGVRNEPLLMIHPCYFRKIESQRRSPFVNNLPNRNHSTSATSITSKRRNRTIHHTMQVMPPQPNQGAQYPQLWEAMPPLVPISASQTNSQAYGTTVKQQRITVTNDTCGAYSTGSVDSGHWTDPERSPDRPDEKHILTGKYRQYLRAHRLHPYVTSAIPIASTFPQMQQVCYNV